MTSTTGTIDRTVLRTVEAENVTVSGERFRLVRAKYGLHKIGNQAPYFTVTGEAWYARPGRRPRDPDTSGCIHDIVGAAFPELADLIALHLSDVTGVPMHAEANGWYWYSANDGKGHGASYNVPERWRELTGPERATVYLRAPRRYFLPDLDRETFADLIEILRPLWLDQATAAIAAHDLDDQS